MISIVFEIGTAAYVDTYVQSARYYIRFFLNYSLLSEKAEPLTVNRRVSLVLGPYDCLYLLNGRLNKVR